MYQEEKVKYCLLVSPETEETEIYELTDNEYQLKEKGKDIYFTFQLDTIVLPILTLLRIWK